MRAGIKITLNDNSIHEAVANVADFIAWERKYKRKASDLANGIGLEDLAYLAWSALKRTGETGADFDAFVADIAEVEAMDVPAPKATRKAALRG